MDSCEGVARDVDLLHVWCSSETTYFHGIKDPISSYIKTNC